MTIDLNVKSLKGKRYYLSNDDEKVKYYNQTGNQVNVAYMHVKS